MIVINTSKGDISIELHEAEAPKTTENFRNYINNNFYNDTIFHRVIDGFMIQGGGLTQSLSQKANEASIINEAKNAKPNKRGTIAMARTSAPHSATSQFFINLADNAFLDFKNESDQGYGYCVFGEVVKGMEVVDAIAKVKTGTKQGYSDVPVEEVIIYGITEV